MRRLSLALSIIETRRDQLYENILLPCLRERSRRILFLFLSRFCPVVPYMVDLFAIIIPKA